MADFTDVLQDAADRFYDCVTEDDDCMDKFFRL